MVEEYEQEELAEDSNDEKRIRRAQSQVLKKRNKQSVNNQASKRPRIKRQHEVNEDRQLFQGKL